MSWLWMVVPIAIYLLERVVRFFRGRRPVEVIEARVHKSNVLEIVMRLRDSHFSYLPGQYIFLQCPAVSRFEWHPFTLTSAPDEPNFSVHIRCVGDWTEAVAERFRTAMDQNSAAFPSLSVDGPFGSPAEESFGYEANVLIGAGIGVTPFVSVMRHIMMRLPQVGKRKWSLFSAILKCIHLSGWQTEESALLLALPRSPPVRMVHRLLGPDGAPAGGEGPGWLLGAAHLPHTRVGWRTNAPDCGECCGRTGLLHGAAGEDALRPARLEPALRCVGHGARGHEGWRVLLRPERTIRTAAQNMQPLLQR